ncbi:MAG: uracil-DNA glycosylase [Patescibacteria group bacterium]|jgi:DNA polymerase
MNKKEELDIIAGEVSKCALCPLSKSRTNTVPGSGDPDADILFVGEAPGEKEDLAGIPFCGAAGKFLDEMLASIGLTREKVFILNTVKCRPPGNRDPEDTEKEACKSYLNRQLEIIKPKLIVCLGRHSCNTFIPAAGGISKLHGKAVKRPNGQVYFALYHPAAALHNGGLRGTLMDDFKKVPAVLKKIKEQETKGNIKPDNDDKPIQTKLI